jgi:diacylglycerol kinase (ATP)
VPIVPRVAQHPVPVHPPRVVAIVNPATRVPPSTIRAALESARPPGAALRFHETARPGDAVAAARSAAAEADIVVAVGGDGTVGDIATGLLGSGVPIAIVPAGSTNIVARELGIPWTIRAAARLVFNRHRIVHRDVGVGEGRCFLHMAGAGFDARMFDRADRALKRRMGWLAYLPAAADALRDPPVRFAIETDDRREEVESPLVLVANGGAVIHPLLRVDRGISATDGRLDVLAFTAVTPAAIARTLSAFAAGRLGDSPDLLVLRTHRVRVDAAPAAPVQFDGDVIGQTPFEAVVAPRAVSFVVPAKPAPR